MTVINSPADLEHLRGTPAFEPTLRAISGALVRKTNIAVHPTTYSDSDYDGPPIAPVWRYEEDQSVLARIGMTRGELDAELAAANLPPIIIPADDGEQLDEVALEAIDADVLTRRSRKAVVAERQRRLNLGFEFDFEDARGVHRIGTTPADQVGWNEVTTIAQVILNGGDTTTEIEIITDTGPVNVTAVEWQQILMAAGMARQPIWKASFALQEMDPIPADYTDDSYWP